MSEGPCVIVTGAAGGIGRELVAMLRADGWRVAALDREAAGLDTLPAGDDLLTQTTDVGDEASVAAAVAGCLAWSGAIDGLVNNAAEAGAAYGPPEELALADWERVLRSNLTGPFLCSRACIPHLARRQGAIVNIASTRAYQSEPHGEPYAASKGGLIALTHALAASCRHRLRVNAIAPGWIVTDPAEELDATDHDQHWAGRVGRPRDVAELVAFLLDGERSGFIDGQCLVCDGGMTRTMLYAD